MEGPGEGFERYVRRAKNVTKGVHNGGFRQEGSGREVR
jgi:hypothetical protein